MNIFTSVILGALIIESTCETLKLLFIEKQFNLIQFGSLVFGVVFSIAYNLDLVSLVGLSSTIPYVGCVITGILLSRGSGFIHDFLDAMFNIMDKTEVK